MLVALDANTPDTAQQLAQAPGWFAAWEQTLSRFLPDSELTRFNQRAGSIVQVSDVLWDVIMSAQQAAQRSHGLVTPTMLAELKQAGYDRSFELLSAQSAAERPPALTPSGDWNAVVLMPSSHSIRLPPGVQLDLGGIAKGWAADRAARQLGIYGPALVDAGGDIALSSPMADGSAWPIAVADPADPDGQLELLMLPSGGIATSGRDYRRWQQAGVWQHHILDPRTGRPAATDVVSATVIGSSAREAEMAAKTVLILGSRAGLAWVEARPTLAALLVLEGQGVVRSRRLELFSWSALAAA
jgi:thiamine biosynthesis lipoprotein